MIQNPILRGFNPDPSIIRVGSDYFIATSTFEWFPGVQIHHSKDLINWRLIAHPLNSLTGLPIFYGALQLNSVNPLDHFLVHLPG